MRTTTNMVSGDQVVWAVLILATMLLAASFFRAFRQRRAQASKPVEDIQEPPAPVEPDPAVTRLTVMLARLKQDDPEAVTELLDDIGTYQSLLSRVRQTPRLHSAFEAAMVSALADELERHLAITRDGEVTIHERLVAWKALEKLLRNLWAETLGSLYQHTEISADTFKEGLKQTQAEYVEALTGLIRDFPGDAEANFERLRDELIGAGRHPSDWATLPALPPEWDEWAYRYITAPTLADYRLHPNAWNNEPDLVTELVRQIGQALATGDQAQATKAFVILTGAKALRGRHPETDMSVDGVRIALASVIASGRPCTIMAIPLPAR